MAKIFSRWVPVTLPFLAGEIALRLRAFDSREAPAFKRAVQDYFASLVQKEGETDEAHNKRVEIMLPAWHALVRDTFERFVRVVEPLEDEDDPTVKITDGASLYKQAPGDFYNAVMIRLAGLASLGDTEGNSSGSHSTSSVEPASPIYVSPVTSTAEEAGPALSTVTGAQSLAESSSRVA